jgi:transcriptional regulator with XRE-family HTH domain
MPKLNAPRELPHEAAVADRVARERAARGWSMETLAQRLTVAGCPIHPSAMHRIETGGRKISVNELVAFSAVFGIPTWELIEEAGVVEANVRSRREEARAAQAEVERLEDELRLARARLEDELRSGLARLEADLEVARARSYRADVALLYVPHTGPNPDYRTARRLPAASAVGAQPESGG